MRLKELGKAIWKKLNSPLKRAPEIALQATCALMLVGGLALMCAEAPAMHRAWLRHKVGKVTYMIVLRDEAGQILGGGTGFQVKAPSGAQYIMTNSHVCDVFKGGSIGVRLHDGRVIPRKIIEISDKTDLCLAEGLPDVDGLKLSDGASIGDSVMSVGHPHLMPLTTYVGEVLGEDLVEFPIALLVPNDTPADKMPPQSMLEKQCAQPKHKKVMLHGWFGEEIPVCMFSIRGLQTTVTSYPGSSGSPVVNFWGNIVGVMFASENETHNGWLIPVRDAAKFLAPY